MFPNLPEIYICYALFYMGGNQKPSRESHQGDTLWCQKKTAQILGKTQTEYFIKKKKFNIMRDTESNFVSVY